MKSLPIMGNHIPTVRSIFFALLWVAVFAATVSAMVADDHQGVEVGSLATHGLLSTAMSTSFQVADWGWGAFFVEMSLGGSYLLFHCGKIFYREQLGLLGSCTMALAFLYFLITPLVLLSFAACF